MSGHPSASVLILASTEETARRWAQILRDRETQVWLSAAELPESAQLDVVLTDGSSHDLPPAVAALVARPRLRFGQPPDRATEPGEGLPYLAEPHGSVVSAGSGDPSLAGHCLAEPSPSELEPPPDTPCCIRLGLIAVGEVDTNRSADVCLPANVSPRELRLACRLLAEVIHLQRALATRAHSERRLVREALTDPLTGLPNRRAWDRRLEKRLAPLPCPDQPFCVAILDLDRFKQVNDTRGHAVGDQVLQTVGRTLGQNLRQGDLVARLGGDEFGLLLSVPNSTTAQSVVDRVRRALPAGLASRDLPTVTASAGFCFVGPVPSAPPLPCPAVLVAAADAALREAKAQGRDRTEAAAT